MFVEKTPWDLLSDVLFWEVTRDKKSNFFDIDFDNIQDVFIFERFYKRLAYMVERVCHTISYRKKNPLWLGCSHSFDYTKINLVLYLEPFETNELLNVDITPEFIEEHGVYGIFFGGNSESNEEQPQEQEEKPKKKRNKKIKNKQNDENDDFDIEDIF
jgi:hypothetical protein